MSLSRDNYARILSRPLGVEWAGWTTDTLTLQECGWKLAVSVDSSVMKYRLMMTHQKMNLYAITDVLTIERLPGDYDGRRHAPVFHVIHVAPDIQVIQTMLPTLGAFEEIDARPQFVESKITSLRDLNVFATRKAEQVLIDKADMTVIEHLEAIKALQSPEQKRLREIASRERSTQPRLQLVANLVSYAR